MSRKNTDRINRKSAAKGSGEGPAVPAAARRSFWSENMKLILGALVLSLCLRVSVVEAYIIPSGSMENTVMTGDTLLGNKFIYGSRLPLIGVRLPALRQPRPGDILVFRHPAEEGERLVKRVVATPGQTVEIRAKKVYVDGQLVPDPKTGQHVDDRILPMGVSNRDYFGPVTVPEGHLFMMGDNRDDSFDSRGWGFLDQDEILAKATFVIYSWDADPTRPFWARVRWGRIGHILR